MPKPYANRMKKKPKSDSGKNPKKQRTQNYTPKK